ncbi:hypothetical protein [Roseibium sp. RKSG952]|nr:hypothetical protein [Roseibium sp. RKSG952]
MHNPVVAIAFDTTSVHAGAALASMICGMSEVNEVAWEPAE